MSRVPLDKTATRFNASNQLRISPGRALHVYIRGTTTHATGYTTEFGGTGVTYPLEADENGRYTAWYEPGPYDLYDPVDDDTQPWEAVKGVDSSDVALVTEFHVEASPWNASGGGIADDTTPIQDAINAASTAAAALGEQVEVTCKPGSIYSVTQIIPKAGVHLNLNGATLKMREDREIVDGPFIWCPETLAGMSYYGEYDDIKISNGFIDPDGHYCHGTLVRMLWTRNLVIDGVTWLDYAPPTPGNGLSGTIAIWAGGRHGRITNCRLRKRDYGDDIHYDGIHIVHGQYWRIANNDVECGDDAIVCGGEATASLVAEPDAIRYVTASNNVVNTTHGFAFGVYVANTLTGTGWEVTDVVVDGLTGKAGINRNGGLKLIDLNAGAAGAQIRRIQIKGVSLELGSTTHDEVNPFGIYCQSLKDLTIQGDFKLVNDSTPTVGMQLIYVESSDDVKLELRCDDLPHLGRLGGVDFDGCNRVRIVNSRLRHGSASDETLLIIDDSDVRIIDSDLLDVQNGETGIGLQGASGGSSLRMRGGKIAHESGATSGSAITAASGTQRLDLDEVDLREVAGIGFAIGSNMGRLRIRDCLGLSNERYKFRLFDDFLGDFLADEWTGFDGSDAEALAPAISLATRGTARLVTGDDAAGTLATNGTRLETLRNWTANLGGCVFEVRIMVSAITNVHLFAGWTNSIGSLLTPFELGGSDALTSHAADAVGFLFDTAADTDNWWAVGVANDVDATKQNLGVAPAASTFETLRVEVTTAGVATFYRNDVQIGTAMTGAITAADAISPVVVAFSRGAASRNIDVDYILAESNR